MLFESVIYKIIYSSKFKFMPEIEFEVGLEYQLQRVFIDCILHSCIRAVCGSRH